MEQKSTFRIFFGDGAFVKVLDFLIEHRSFDYTLTDIARLADVAWSTVNLLWPRLLEHEIVVATRQVGRAKLFKLNMQSRVVKHLIKVDWALSKREARKVARQELEKRKKRRALVKVRS